MHTISIHINIRILALLKTDSKCFYRLQKFKLHIVEYILYSVALTTII